MVWHPEITTQDYGYDAGNHDPSISLAIRDRIALAEQDYPFYSPIGRILRKRYDYIQDSIEVQEEYQAWKRAWWDSWVYPPDVLRAPTRNETSDCDSEKTLTMSRGSRANCSIAGKNDVDNN